MHRSFLAPLTRPRAIFKTGLLLVGLSLGLWTGLPASASGNLIEQACRQSQRGAAQATLCRCIQQVAEVQLTRSDQRAVSKWFADPHEAQVVRQSKSRRDNELWQRYKQFGDAAAQSCG